MNERAAAFVPPFSVSRSQVTYYRNTRAADIEAMVAAGEQEALSEGLALKGERVKKLKQLAALMERDLFGGFLWTEQVKGAGTGDVAQIVEYEEFNAPEVAAYRGVLDDIAKELGDRKAGDTSVEVNIFDIDEWKTKRKERLEQAEQMDGIECGTADG